MKADDSDPDARQHDGSIAIIGLAGRFPGAPNATTFWSNLRDGVESIRRLSSAELEAAGVSREEREADDYVAACPVLERIDEFDASFFGMSPRDASVMDPAHRIFLETCWEALEDAGHAARPEDGAVGVFAASGAPLYWMEHLRTNPELMRSMGEFLVRHTGNDMNFLATRVSYALDLRGPSINVQTACSSALVAVHLACQSLLRSECSLALAGGSTVLIPNGRGYAYREGEILSPDGHCRPFDAASAGTVFGSGAGCVVLKRLADALDDGDTVRAIIRGSSINNDGARKVGYLAPGVEGQIGVIRAALRAANVDAASIGYVEAHGTGTRVGDPIEVEALAAAYRSDTKLCQFAGLGSVKGNIGHLGEAAGIASLIKATLALEHRELPPSLGYRTANPQIDFAASPFFVNERLRAWESDGPRRCGVTAVGAGGTNCHVILEEAPEALAPDAGRARQLLVVSAKTASALDLASHHLADGLERAPAPNLADAAYTLAEGRRAMTYRRVLVASDAHEAATKLRERDPRQVATARSDGPAPSLVFLFPGGGAQYAGMGAELHANEPVYRDAFDACMKIIEAESGVDLRRLVLAAPADLEQTSRELERPSFALPALFATEYALARLFESWGAAPSAYVGHSMGEYVAACLAGVFDLADALGLVLLRGRLFESVAPGAMLGVQTSEATLRELMPQDLSIAAVNAPELCVASGPVASIEALEARLTSLDVEHTRIRIDVAAHSSLLDPILEPFRALCRRITLRAPRVPFVSNLTGAFITEREATDPEYWVRHLRSTVRFAACMESVLARGPCVLLEVGPGRTLSTLARAQPSPARHAVSAMRHPHEVGSDVEAALLALGKLWSVGVAVDWSAFYEGQLRSRIPLPTYPFERRSFWVQPGGAPRASANSNALTKRPEIETWFYDLAWSRQPLLEHGAVRDERWLVFSNESRLAVQLIERLGPSVVVVTPGTAVTRVGQAHFRLDPTSSNQYVELFQALEEADLLPDHVVYAWSASTRASITARLRPPRVEELGRRLEESFFGPTHLARVLGTLPGPVEFSVITSGLVQVADEWTTPCRATALGPVLVAPREYARLATRCIDLAETWVPSATVVDRLVAELRARPRDALVALRTSGRWVQRIAPLPLPAAPSHATWLRRGGVYLVTGGLGGIGLELATHMAKQQRIKLALLGRSELPSEALWDDILKTSDPSSRGAQRIAKVRALRALGAEVLVLAADVTCRESLGAALARVRGELGPITGVLHAAGLVDDEPMHEKSRPSMIQVLAPKVHGTLLLDALVHEDLDFFVLLSSVASVLGLAGQVDYTAANAFLDAFARHRSRRSRGRTLVVNWNAWRDVGMAERFHRGRLGGIEPASPCAHPALDGFTDLGRDTREFVTDFRVDGQWLLSEHRIRGSYALLPGTAFVELARAAFAVGRERTSIELSNLHFLSPFQVPDDETRRLHVRLTAAGDAHEVTMRSSPDPKSPPHVIGDVRVYVGTRPPRIDLASVRDRCAERVETPHGRLLAQEFVTFGPRWANLERIHFGRAEALIELALDPDFVADLEHFVLHPALLDMATGAAQALIPDVDLRTDFYVPVHYERLRVHGPMPPRFVSHVRCLADSGRGMAHFDVTLVDADGLPFVEIGRFSMKRIDPGSAITRAPAPRATGRRTDTMSALLREAITPPEGVEAFDRIMAQPDLVQVVVSSVDVIAWRAELDAPAATPVTTASAASRHAQASADASPDDGPAGFGRPELANDYEAPSTPTEIFLAGVWSELLGVRRVGVGDDFFDLGGNSLLAVRLFAAIKKRWRLSMPLSTLFAAPNVRALASHLDASLGPSVAEPMEPTTRSDGGTSARTPAPKGPAPARYSSLVPMQPGGTRPPFYCAAGMGGNPLNLRSLALLVGLDQPFYGLQPQGLDGQSRLHGSVPEIAAHYLAHIKEKQPKGPYYVGGFSGGGVTAFELARQFRAAGDEVGALVLLDSIAPLLPSRSRMERANVHYERLREQGAAYLVDTLGRRLRSEWLGVERSVRRPLGRLFPYHFRLENVEDAWVDAARAYRPEPYSGDAILFRAVVRGALTAGTAHEIDELQGWGPWVRGGVEVSVCPGEHATMCEEPHVRVLARRLRGYLDRRMSERGQLPAETPVVARAAG